MNIFANRKLLAEVSVPKEQQKPGVHTVATPGRMNSSINDQKEKEKVMKVVTLTLWFGLCVRTFSINLTFLRVRKDKGKGKAECLVDERY